MCLDEKYVIYKANRISVNCIAEHKIAIKQVEF